MSGRLAGKVAIVTGAASSGPGVGNGRATAILFAREGARVLLVNRSEAHASELQREIEKSGGTSSVCAADIADESQVRRMVDTAVDRYGRLDILHNNVGIGGRGTAVDVAERVWDDAVNVNLKGTLWCCRHAIPRMIESGGGSIINVTSIAAVRGFRRGDAGFAAYSASKAGIEGLTRSLAADFAGRAIRANCLRVGIVHTPLLARLGEEVGEKIRLATPLLTEGTGWDVGWAAVYLASDEAKWVTGTSITVDGGQSCMMEFPG